jgi:hypothetical protein
VLHSRENEIPLTCTEYRFRGNDGEAEFAAKVGTLNVPFALSLSKGSAAISVLRARLSVHPSTGSGRTEEEGCSGLKAKTVKEGAHQAKKPHQSPASRGVPDQSMDAGLPA